MSVSNVEDGVEKVVKPVLPKNEKIVSKMALVKEETKDQIT